MILLTDPLIFSSLKYRDSVTCKCEFCSKNFQTTKATAQRALRGSDKKAKGMLKYCSPQCGHEARRKTEPLICQYCSCGFFDVPSHNRKYCSRQCYGNAETKELTRRCRQCDIPVPLRNWYFCSHRCRRESAYIQTIENWISGKNSGCTPSGLVVEPVKNYLRKKSFESCELCGWNQLNEKTKRCPLQIDHKDGNFRNCRPDNLRVLCPNCHSLTPTFMGLNRGKGRSHRHKNAYDV